MRSTLSEMTASLILGVLCTLLPSSCRAEDVESLDKAKKLIKAEQALIASFCHPTATLKSTDFEKSSETSKGWKISCRFNFKSALRNEFSTTLALYFDKKGKFVGPVSVVSTTTTNPLGQPFMASSKAFEVIKNKLLSELKENAEPEEVRRIEKADAQDLLEFILKRK